MLDLPTLGLVIGSAAIDSINPCAIGVLILMISVVLGGNKGTKRLLTVGLAYIGAIFLTYLVAGLGLVYFFTKVPIVIAEYLSMLVAALIVVAAVIEIKEYFWYGKGFSLQIPTKFAKKIHEWSMSKTSVLGVMALGAFVAAVELPCTGAPYLAIITVLGCRIPASYRRINRTAFGRIDPNIAIIFYKAAAPSAVTWVLEGTQSVVYQMHKCRCVTFADVALAIPGTQRTVVVPNIGI